MAFPTNPTEGQIYKNKMWSAASNAWVDSSAIVESGSNENGSYRKFSDGTMECWKYGSYSFTTTGAAGADASYGLLPVDFVGSIRSSYASLGWEATNWAERPTIEGCASSNFDFHYNYQFATTKTIEVYRYVIGRWKA